MGSGGYCPTLSPGMKPRRWRTFQFLPPVKDTFGRMQVIREVIQLLKQVGALLIFPRGDIKPDPDFMPDPDCEFNQWSRSLEVLLRQVPQTRLLLTIVSGVVSQDAIQHPITWFRRSRKDRQRLAYIYQIIRQVLSGKELNGLKPQVTFGEILSETNGQKVLAQIERAARNTLQQHISYFRIGSQPLRKRLFTKCLIALNLLRNIASYTNNAVSSSYSPSYGMDLPNGAGLFH